MFIIKYLDAKAFFTMLDVLARLITYHWPGVSPCLKEGADESVASYNARMEVRAAIRDKLVEDYQKGAAMNVHKVVTFFEGTENEFEYNVHAAWKAPSKARFISLFSEWLRQFDDSGFNLADAKKIGYYKTKQDKTGHNSDIKSQHEYVANYLRTRSGTTVTSIKIAHRETESFLATI